MDTNAVRKFLKDALDAVDVIEASAAVQAEVEAAEKRREAAELGYRQAHGERAQIIEAIENLKKQFEEQQDIYRADSQRLDDERNERARQAEKDTDVFVALQAQRASSAESEAAQRIAAAVVEAEEVEARVVAAKAALEALKRA